MFENHPKSRRYLKFTRFSLYFRNKKFWKPKIPILFAHLEEIFLEMWMAAFGLKTIFSLISALPDFFQILNKFFGLFYIAMIILWKFGKNYVQFVIFFLTMYRIELFKKIMLYPLGYFEAFIMSLRPHKTSLVPLKNDLNFSTKREIKWLSVFDFQISRTNLNFSIHKSFRKS